MNPTHLRIGNIVRDKVSGEWMRITELSETTVYGTVINRDKFPLSPGWEMEGVPITPDVLVKCGFVKDGNEYYLGHKALRDMDLKASEYAGDWSIYLHKTNWQNSVRTFYLHSLMNLFFALTGEELNYSL